MAPRATPEQSAAGVPAFTHRPFTGTHDHLHPAFGGLDTDGDGAHEHRHTHRGDADHHHSHAAANMGAGKSAHVPTPALDQVASSRSLHEGISTLLAQGRAHQAANELHRVAAAAESLRGASKALDYRRKAEAATDPMDRRSYTQLAKQAEAGAL